MADDESFDANQAALNMYAADFVDLAARELTPADIRDLECLHGQIGEALGRMRASMAGAPG